MKKSAASPWVWLGRIGIPAIMLCVCIATLYPLINLLAISLSGKSPVMRGAVALLPRDFTLDAYKNVLNHGYLFTAYRNTLVIVITGTALNIALTTLTAYPLSKRRLRGRTYITFFLAFTMWFSGGMIPTYLVVKNTGLLNTYWSVILPGAVGAYNTIILRNFFQTIPESLEESARIDGAGDCCILYRIILPLCKPILATITLWCAVGHWNSFFGPLLYFSDSDMYPLQVYLRDIVISSQLDKYGMISLSEIANMAVQSESIINATIIVSMAPIVALYPCLQKYFTRGIIVGAIKG